MENADKRGTLSGKHRWKHISEQLNPLLHDRSIMANEEQFFKNALLAESNENLAKWEE